MPIRTACTSCGKKLQVRDELVGKKAKCPECGTVFVIAAAAAPPAPSAPPKAGPAAKVPPQAKKKPVPMDDDEEMEERTVPQPKVKKPARPIDDDDEDDEDSDDRPVRPGGRGAAKKASSGRRGLLLTALVVLLLAAAAGAYFMFFTGPQKTVPAAAALKNKPAKPIETTALETSEPISPPKTKLDSSAGTVALADLVPGDTLGFVSVSASLWNSPGLADIRAKVGPVAEGEFQKIFGFPMADLERVTAFTVADFAGLSRSDQPPFVFVVQTSKPFQQQAVLAAINNGPLAKEARFGTEFLSDRALLLATADVFALYKTKKGQSKATGVLDRALTAAATSKGVVAAAVVPPELVKLELGLKEAPPFLAPLLKTRSIFASLDIQERLALQVSLLVDDAGTAKELKGAADNLMAFASKGLADAAKDEEMAAFVKPGEAALKDLRFEAQDKELVLTFQADVNKLIGDATPIVGKLTGAASATSDTNNLKQVVLAWHVYHDANKTMPPQIVGKGLSWRVAILPFLEQVELYQKFKLDEPWDSPENIKLLPLMPKIYESGKLKAPPGQTFLQTFVGPNTINKDPQKAMSIPQIADGTSNTIILAEAARPVEWTKPEDIKIDPKQPVVLGGADPKYILVAFADGSVQKIARTLDQQLLRWLIDPADGNPLPPNWNAAPPPKKK